MEYITVNEKMIAEHKSKMNTIRAKYGNMTADLAYFALMSHELGELKQLVAKQTELLSKLLETPEVIVGATKPVEFKTESKPIVVEDYTTSIKK